MKAKYPLPPFLRKTLVLGSLAVVLAGCGRTDAQVTGLWIGTVTNSLTSQSYSLSIKPDGKITFEGFTLNQEQFGYGTWQLNGEDFTATVKTNCGFEENIGVVQKLTAKFNPSTGVISEGKYFTIHPAAPDSGRFFVSKVR